MNSRLCSQPRRTEREHILATSKTFLRPRSLYAGASRTQYPQISNRQAGRNIALHFPAALRPTASRCPPTREKLMRKVRVGKSTQERGFDGCRRPKRSVANPITMRQLRTKQTARRRSPGTHPEPAIYVAQRSR